MKTKRNIFSNWFLLYSKKIPLEIFWNEYSFLQNFQKNKDGSLNIFLLYFFLFIGYLLSFVLAVAPLIWLSNLFVRKLFAKSFFLFFLENRKEQEISNQEQRFNQFILWINRRPQQQFFLFLNNLAKVIGLLIVLLGANEVYNSFFSHSTPDWFDFFFPENGTTFFWGGLTFLNFSFFMQDFLIEPKNLNIEKQRKILAQRMPLAIRKVVIT